MPRYTYTDWAKGPVLYTVKQSTRGGMPWSNGPYHDKRAGEVIFECEAPDILAADTQFSETTGRTAAKEFLVGCSIS